MKQFLGNAGPILFLISLIAACAAPATDAPVEATPTPLLTATPAFLPVTGPSMKVGSTYLYVDGTVLAAVPAGEFTMGADGEDNPEHQVRLDDYWIYATKVTNQQYELCVNQGQCTSPYLDDNLAYTDKTLANHPVVGVTYDQAASYCAFVNGRLPTEAEWEKSARDPEGSLYPWGDVEPYCDLLNFNDCVGSITNVLNYQMTVSYYGALDMAGNVFEWVADWYDPDYYNNSPAENPQGPESGTARAVRSSNYAASIEQIPVPIRNAEEPQNHRPDLGFRCVVEDPTYFAPFCEAPLVHGNQQVGVAGTCPEIGIEQYPACARKLSTTNVVFIGPDDAELDAGGCTPTDDPSAFNCLAEAEVSISATCQVDFSGEPTCGPGYSLEGATCKPNGTKGACLSGLDYDSTRGCCSAGSQTDNLDSVSVCPVGTFRVAGHNICTPNPVQGMVSLVELIRLESCTEGVASAATSTSTGDGPTPEARPTLVVVAPTGGGRPTLAEEPTVDVAPTLEEVPTVVVVPTIKEVPTVAPPACQEQPNQCDDYEDWDSVKCECYDPSCKEPAEGCSEGEIWYSNMCSCAPEE